RRSSTRPKPTIRTSPRRTPAIPISGAGTRPRSWRSSPCTRRSTARRSARADCRGGPPGSIGFMAGQPHHEHAGDSLVAEAEDVLTAAGEQWTAMRADVFEALAAHHRPASAYDIAEAVGSKRGKRVAANSVYRILDLFVRTNLANRVESA